MKKSLFNRGYIRLAAALILSFASIAAVMLVPRVGPVKDYTSMDELMFERYGHTGFDECDMVQYDYDMLYNSPGTIAVVECLDDLTAENSHGISASGDRFNNAYSVRNVRAVQFFKNDGNYGEQFQIGQFCAMADNGSVAGDEGAYPMNKGDYYLVFLRNSGLPKGLEASRSTDNGLFDLKYLKLNDEHAKVCADAVFNLLSQTNSRGISDFPEDKFTDASYYMSSDSEGYEEFCSGISWSTCEISTPYTASNMKMPIEYAQIDGEWYFRLAGPYGGFLIYK